MDTGDAYQDNACPYLHAVIAYRTHAHAQTGTHIQPRCGIKLDIYVAGSCVYNAEDVISLSVSGLLHANTPLS